MIAVCVPIWGRHALTEKVLRRWQGIQKRHDIEIYVGISEDVPYNIHGLRRVICKNEPLGQKFNDIIYAAGTGFFGSPRPDAVMMVGSDDLIHEDYLHYLQEKKPDFAVLGQCYYFEQATGKMLRHWQAAVGAGKYMAAKILDRCGWQPYEPEKNLNVDGGPERFVAQGEKHHLVSPVGPWCIDVKSPDENMWGFGVIENKYRNTEPADAAAVFAAFGEDVSDWALNKGLSSSPPHFVS